MRKNFFSALNIMNRCKEYHLPLWQCPDFLFPLMGVVIIGAMVVSYFIANRYVSPEVLIIIISLLTAILLIIGYAINKSFETLAEANRVKSEFVRIASHQLRTPVTAIGWAVDLLKSERIEDPNIRKQVEVIAKSHHEMAKLITNLLEVSRMEEGRFNLLSAPVSLAEITTFVVNELSSLAKASNVTIHWKPPSDAPIIQADPSRMQLAIHNLLENAVTYINGKGEVWVELWIKGNWIHWHVRDTGVGIPKHQQKKIFTKFFRSDNIMRHQTRGNGLGLFITKSIITASGGKIGFSSQEGKGSIFWFKLPLIK